MEKFQTIMEQMLKDCECVCILINAVLIHGSDEQILMQRVNATDLK